MRAGLESDAVTGVVVPLIQLIANFACLRCGDKRAYDYTRSSNPTRDLLGAAIADLEGGAGAVITASGMGAITLVGHLLKVGARIVAPHDSYGGTHRLFDAWQRRGELQAEFVDFGDAAAVRTALGKPAAMVWIETPSNPLRITDIAAVARRPAGRRARGRRQHLPVARLAAAVASRRGPRRSFTQIHQWHSDVVGGAVWQDA